MHPTGEPALTKAEIAAELYQILELLGAKSDLLQIIGSYSDTMDDEWVLEELRRWRQNREPADVI